MTHIIGRQFRRIEPEFTLFLILNLKKLQIFELFVHLNKEMGIVTKNLVICKKNLIHKSKTGIGQLAGCLVSTIEKSS